MRTICEPSAGADTPLGLNRRAKSEACHPLDAIFSGPTQCLMSSRHVMWHTNLANATCWRNAGRERLTPGFPGLLHNWAIVLLTLFNKMMSQPDLQLPAALCQLPS